MLIPGVKPKLEFTPNFLWLSRALEMLRANARNFSMIMLKSGVCWRRRCVRNSSPRSKEKSLPGLSYNSS